MGTQTQGPEQSKGRTGPAGLDQTAATQPHHREEGRGRQGVPRLRGWAVAGARPHKRPRARLGPASPLRDGRTDRRTQRSGSGPGRPVQRPLSFSFCWAQRSPPRRGAAAVVLCFKGVFLLGAPRWAVRPTPSPAAVVAERRPGR